MAITLALAAGSAGCAATVGPEGAVVTTGVGLSVYGYPSVYATVTPVDIDLYPRVYYRGAYAYYVDDSWYYLSDGRWVVFRTEPPELHQYRVRYLPPTYRGSYIGRPREAQPRRYERRFERRFERREERRDERPYERRFERREERREERRD